MKAHRKIPGYASLPACSLGKRPIDRNQSPQTSGDALVPIHSSFADTARWKRCVPRGLVMKPSAPLDNLRYRARPFSFPDAKIREWFSLRVLDFNDELARGQHQRLRRTLRQNFQLIYGNGVGVFKR